MRKLIYRGNKFIGGGGLRQYVVSGTDPPIDLTKVVNQPGCTGGGLFQLQTVDSSTMDKLRKPGGSQYPGLSLSLKWQLPGKNYFNVDFGNMPSVFPNSAPELHTTVSVGANNPNANVWPDPTPKFQVRQYP